MAERTTLADDEDAVLEARELAQRLQLIKELAAHPAINRCQIERHRAECNALIGTISAHLLTAVFE